MLSLWDEMHSGPRVLIGLALMGLAWVYILTTAKKESAECDAMPADCVTPNRQDKRKRVGHSPPGLPLLLFNSVRTSR